MGVKKEKYDHQAENDKGRKSEILRRFIKPYSKLTCMQVGIVLICVVVLAANSFLREPWIKYRSSNVVAGSDPAVPQSMMDIQNNYFLDISPTMFGFVNSGGNLRNLAQVLRNMDQGQSNYYTCGAEIENQDAGQFYEVLENVDYWDDYYGQLAVDEGSSAVSVMSSMDFSRVFTDSYSDGIWYSTNPEAVNVLISDFLFSQNPVHNVLNDNSYMERFASELAQRLNNTNICIYNIHSNYLGYGEEEYGGNIIRVDNATYMLIVLGANDAAYNSYIDRLEEELQRNQFDFSERFEIKNDLLENNHTIEPDTALFHDSSQTELVNLNYDSKSFERISDTPLGVRIIRNNDNVRLSMPVMEWSAAGLYDNSSNTNQTEIGTTVKAYSARFNGYEEIQNLNWLTGCRGFLRKRAEDDQWYLYLDLELQPDLEDWVGNRLRRYCVLDIRFSLGTPDFSIPEWVGTMNQNEWTDDYGMKSKILSLFEMICAEKEREMNETNFTESYQRQIGNVELYIKY